MRPELPTGTVTFLFTDVEGSTPLLDELGAQPYAEALAEHRRAIRAACASEDGIEVDTQGDAFFFAFPTAPAAFAAAGLLWGAIEVDRVGAPLGGWIRHRAACEARIAAARSPALDDAIARGRDLSLDEAVELALRP